MSFRFNRINTHITHKDSSFIHRVSTVLSRVVPRVEIDRVVPHPYPGAFSNWLSLTKEKLVLSNEHSLGIQNTIKDRPPNPVVDKHTVGTQLYFMDIFLYYNNVVGQFVFYWLVFCLYIIASNFVFLCVLCVCVRARVCLNVYLSVCMYLYSFFSFVSFLFVLLCFFFFYLPVYFL